ncbi:MAG: hypothetical protein WB341_03705 [Terracidiphilus sp.]
MAAQTRNLTRAVLLGLLSWLIPFAAGFVLFPVRRSNAPLFSTLMYLVVLVTAGALLAFYFRQRVVSVREAAAVGTIWLAMNLILDYPMFAFGPMKMSPLGYYSEIGLVYLTFPVFSILAARPAKP